jgi:hypothetical protein
MLRHATTTAAAAARCSLEETRRPASIEPQRLPVSPHTSNAPRNPTSNALRTRTASVDTGSVEGGAVQRE